MFRIDVVFCDHSPHNGSLIILYLNFVLSKICSSGSLKRAQITRTKMLRSLSGSLQKIWRGFVAFESFIFIQKLIYLLQKLLRSIFMHRKLEIRSFETRAYRDSLVRSWQMRGLYQTNTLRLLHTITSLSILIAAASRLEGARSFQHFF